MKPIKYYDAKRYLACAKRWRLKGELVTAVLYLNKAARCRKQEQ